MQFVVTRELLKDVREYVDTFFEGESTYAMDFAEEADFSCPSSTPRCSYGSYSPEPMPSMRAETSPPEKPSVLSRFADFAASKKQAAPFDDHPRSLSDVIDQVEDTFSESLFRLIDQRGLEDPEVYKRARVDRKLFSKIRSNAGYQPSKNTALCLALALELSLDETLDLIGRAGFTLTHASKSDLVVEYFIQHKCWDIQTINEVLYELELPLL